MVRTVGRRLLDGAGRAQRHSSSGVGIAESVVPAVLSVNYFPSRKCNYACGFCFHTAKNTDMLSLDDAKRGMRLLQQAGTKKINIAGGEPFVFAGFLGNLVEYCHQELGFAVSIISNGSLIRESWMRRFGANVGVLGVSCDSFDNATNRKIGRSSPNGKKEHATSVFAVREWCAELGIKFKLNTVVNTHNKDEDMNAQIARLDPFRWKCFQVLMLNGENSGLGKDLRDARSFQISDTEFQQFVQRHAGQASLVPEDNSTMQNSYLLLDEKLRFLDCSHGNKIPSRSILDVGVEEALANAGFDRDMFLMRGGVYDWSSSTGSPIE